MPSSGNTPERVTVSADAGDRLTYSRFAGINAGLPAAMDLTFSLQLGTSIVAGRIRALLGLAQETRMSDRPNTRNMALFCDFENVALGVRDAKYAAFDIRKVLERLLLKGNIVVKKAYCDWERYKEFKKPMHEAAFELIEINKTVIGVGVKNSSSDLLVSGCDEFIYYDDLAREPESKRKRRSRPAAKKGAAPRDKESKEKEPELPPVDDKRQEALDLVMATIEDLFEERGQEEKVWASMVKQTLKRRKPGFNESYHGFRTFGQLLEEAQARHLLELEMDEKSGSYIVKSFQQED
mgnify:CR=1 FL=1